ncbi:hypothetical protein BT96DRAFT_803177, partial [Gymnopus androsaceus JB14]
IFAHLDVSTLFSLKRTCKAGRVYVDHLHKRAFTVKLALRPFFKESEVKCFQCLQAATGLIIGGSIALKFFTRQCYHSDMDVYCYLPRCDVVAMWLQSIGYVFQ